MAIVAGFDVHRSADHVRRAGHRDGRGTARPDRRHRRRRCGRGRSASPAREVQVAVEACTGWLFVCDALVGGGGGGASGRAGGDERVARSQAARQDRSRGRALAARAARRGPAAGGVDPARARAPVALAGAAAPHADRRAHAVAAAHPGDAVSPRHRRHARSSCAPPTGARSSQRSTLPPDARERIEIALAMIDAIEAQIVAARARAAPAGAPPDRLPGADGPLRDGRADLAGHALRARRRRSACRRRARRSGWPASTSACTAPTAARGSASSPARAPRSCAGRSTRPR